MECQLTASGRLSAPFTNLANLEELLGANSDETSDSGALYLQRDLKEEHAHLDRKVKTLKLKLAALQIQTNYQQQRLKKLSMENSYKSKFSKGIKKTLMLAARHSLQSQDPETFPSHFISQMFEAFAGDEKLTDHFKTLDYELRKIVQKMCIHAHERQKSSLQGIVNEKAKKVMQKFIEKYENQLAKQDESQKRSALAMKEKCFDLLKQFLLTDISDQSCGEEYINQLEVLYEQEILK
ncbi:uncharacterized protein LOC128252485 [Drosophila gunungcola]|uniref:uncharacterized protein LOC128252485 n=1 Tax=Drosophila gunungcola TaxID=103775 RepID=UPI0022E64640|nr:uncharacterized protein LOC128252485 [Drosophila gunungcola]